MTSSAACRLHRYADVHAALRDDRLVPFGAPKAGDQTHRDVRDAIMHELPPALVESWRAPLAVRAREMLGALPVGPADLVAHVAQPWALEATQRILRMPADVVAAGVPLACIIFEESAIARGGAPSMKMSRAAAALAALLAAFGGVGTVQSFVALTHTVPALVSGAWLALLQHPTQLTWLRKALAESHENGDHLSVAISELLRFAGPSRALFRVAIAPVTIGDISMETGDAVALMLSAANRDGEKFSDADCLDLQRSPAGHLAFGAGVHGCVGATIVRMLLQEAIVALVRMPCTFELVDDGSGVRWLEGFSLRAPQCVPVVVCAPAVAT